MGRGATHSWWSCFCMTTLKEDMHRRLRNFSLLFFGREGYLLPGSFCLLARTWCSKPMRTEGTNPEHIQVYTQNLFCHYNVAIYSLDLFASMMALLFM